MLPEPLYFSLDRGGNLGFSSSIEYEVADNLSSNSKAEGWRGPYDPGSNAMLCKARMLFQLAENPGGGI